MNEAYINMFEKIKLFSFFINLIAQMKLMLLLFKN